MFVGIAQLILGRKLRAMSAIQFRLARGLVVRDAAGKCATETPPEQRVPRVIEEHQIGHNEAEQQQFDQTQPIDLHGEQDQVFCMCALGRSATGV